MLRYIAIMFTRAEALSLGKPFSEITARDFVHFNEKEVNLVGAENSMEYSSVILYFTHPEFRAYQKGFICPMFYLDEAKARYPFLFFNTNPLLYRRFK